MWELKKEYSKKKKKEELFAEKNQNLVFCKKYHQFRE